MTLAVRARALAAVVVVALALGGCGGSTSRRASSSRSEPSYGALPTFLPTATLRPNGELTGRPQRPAVTTQGAAVYAVLAHGSVHATVTGPAVPVEGAAQQPDATTCTWSVTLTAARGEVPVAVSDFSVLDEQGNETKPRLAPGSAVPSATITPGQRVSFELRAVMPAGEGVVRWAPEGHVVASWDFVAETD